MRIQWKIGLTAGSLLGIAAVVLSPALTGCGGDNAGESSAPKEIVVDGSSTVFRISSAAQEAYSKRQPRRDGRSSTTTAPAAASAATSRARWTSSTPRGPPSPTRRPRPRSSGLEWTRFLVGYDGITLVVNPKNDFVKSLTVEQLKKIWEPDSKVKTWKDVDPSWPDRKIVLYCPDKDSGTFEFFTEAIVGKAKSQRERRPGQLRRQHPGQGRGRRRGRSGLLRLRLLRRQQGQAPRRRRPERPRRQARPADPRDHPGQELRPALATALSST